MNQLHEARFTGALSFSKRDKKKKLWFSRGEVFRAQSNLVPELIGRMMVGRHWLTEADLNTCLNLQRDLMTDAKSSKRLAVRGKDLPKASRAIPGDLQATNPQAFLKKYLTRRPSKEIPLSCECRCRSY